MILIGRQEERPINRYIQSHCFDSAGTNTGNQKERILDFAGLTNIKQLAFLLQKSILVVSCDTGVLHLASYFDVPVIGLFGPSDEKIYGPWSNNFKIVSENIECRPCRKPDCKLKTVECMSKISVDKVLDSIDAVIKS